MHSPVQSHATNCKSIKDSPYARIGSAPKVSPDPNGRRRFRKKPAHGHARCKWRMSFLASGIVAMSPDLTASSISRESWPNRQRSRRELTCSDRRPGRTRGISADRTRSRRNVERYSSQLHFGLHGVTRGLSPRAGSAAGSGRPAPLNKALLGCQSSRSAILEADLR